MLSKQSQVLLCYPFKRPRQQLRSDAVDELPSGGIDSDGITERAANMTPLMAAVSQGHAAEASCPAVLSEFHIWPGGNRRLFAGIDRFDTPVSDIAEELAIEAGSWETRQTISLNVSLAAGTKTVRLAFTNDS